MSPKGKRIVLIIIVAFVIITISYIAYLKYNKLSEEQIYNTLRDTLFMGRP